MNTAALESAIATSRALLRELATDSDRFSQVLSTAFDVGYDESMAENLRQEWLSDDFSQLPGIEAIAGSELNGASGVYAAATDTIYLSQAFLETATAEQVASVLLEEIGHGVESRVSDRDSTGDEGEIFSTLARGLELSDSQLEVLRQQNDAAEVVLNGQVLAAEQATLTVNSTEDNLTSGDGLVTLREAIIAANNDTATDTGQTGSGADVITLGAGTFELAIAGTEEDASAEGDFDITSDITIRGAGAGVTIIDANQIDRVFDVNIGAKLTLENVTVTGGSTTGDGGGIRVDVISELAIADSAVLGNLAQNAGGGVFNSSSSTLSLSNSSVSNNTTQGYGGGIVNVGSMTTLSNSSISDNSADVSAGGIFNIGSMSLSNSSVSNNTTQGDGGGIANSVVGFTSLSNSIVSGNSADGGGGIFNNFGSSISLSNSTILSNSAYVGGGIVNFDYSTVSLSNSGILGNFAALSGGGIYNRRFSEAIVNNSNISGNSSNFSGGGIYINYSTATLSGSNISGNSAVVGGGVYSILSTATLTDSTVSGNSALNAGGGIHSRSSTATLSNSNVSSNSAGIGGGIYNNSSTVTLSNVTISINTAFEGGGIFNSSSTATLSNSIVSGNSSNFKGGGIFNSLATATLNNSTVSANSAGEDGGGIYNAFATATLNDSNISGNSSDFRGGGIFNASASATLSNSTVSDNFANSRGGGIFMDSSTATLNNSTVSGNTALDGGGIFSGASVSTVVSTIVGDNVASTAPDLNNSSSFLNISNSLVEDASGNGLANGVYNNIVGLDPQLDPNGLQDNGGSTQTIALLPISPAIDAGSNPNGLSSDQRGADRTIGAGTDIGAFEVFGSSAIVVDTLEDSMDGDFSEGDRSLREALEFISAGGHITFASNLSNQTITLNGSELLVSREVTIDGESNNITLDANSTSRVLRIDDGDSSNAIAVSIAGLTITGGSVSGYGGGILNLESLSFSNSNVLGNTATLDGGGIFNDFSIANISDSTVSGNVARDGGGIFNNSSTATVSYSTISGNSANGIGGGTFGGTGGGIRNRDSTLTVSNSTISNNSIRSDGGGIFSIRSFSTVNNSTVSGNSARSDGGGIFNVDSTSAVSNSTISGNTANDGGGGVFNQSSTSTISGSTISRNLSRKDGGGIHNRSSSNSTVSNSTVFDNTALFDGGGIYSRSSTLTLQNSTVSSNSAVRDTGGGIYMRSSASSIVSTIIGDNTASAAPDLSTSFGTLSISNSLVEDVSGNGLVNGNDGNIVGLDPNLDPSGLQNNGGTTETVALLSTSPAIDAGSNPNNLGADQRGKARTVGAVTDIGAFEFNAAPSITSAPIANVPENQTFAIDVQATDDNDVEGAGLTYSISGGDDASAFAIDVSTGVVTFLNAPDFENPTDANGDNVFELQVAVTDSGGLTASQDITINLNDLGDFWFTLNRNTNGFGNVEDIVQFDGVSTFGLFFDGSDVGLGGANVNAFDIISSTEILMSFGAPLTISGLGAVDDSDIVKFTATSLGEGTTAGTFDLFLDGDAVGLTSNGEDIDAIAGLPDGSLLLSTVGGARWGNGLRTKDEDLVRYDPISGSLALEFDGSDVGLTASGEDVDAAGFQNGRLQFSTNGNFSVPGISGFDEDIFSYTPSSSGGNTSGLFDTSLFFEGNQFGLARDIVGADFSIG